MKNVIKHQFFFPHSVERVWEYLTKSDLMEQWLMKNTFEPVVGHEFQFTTKPIPSLDFDGIFYCKVLEIVPFKKLSYTWKGGRAKDDITLDSLVVWKLESSEKGTNVFLEHIGFDHEENLAFYQGMTDGWLKNLQKIEARLNERTDGTTQA